MQPSFFFVNEWQFVIELYIVIYCVFDHITETLHYACWPRRRNRSVKVCELIESQQAVKMYVSACSCGVISVLTECSQMLRAAGVIRRLSDLRVCDDGEEPCIWKRPGASHCPVSSPAARSAPPVPVRLQRVVSLAEIPVPLAWRDMGAVGAMPFSPLLQHDSGARERAWGGLIYSGLCRIFKGLAEDQRRWSVAFSSCD